MYRIEDMEDNGVRKTKGGIVHPRVERAIAKIGEDISNARRVRRITADDFAQRIGVSRQTLHRLENGDPGISLNTMAMALHAIGRLEALANIAESADDHVTMMQMKDDAPKRINKPRVSQPNEDIEDTAERAYEDRDAENKFKGF